jgi:hypothetical protein
MAESEPLWLAFFLELSASCDGKPKWVQNFLADERAGVGWLHTDIHACFVQQ